MWHMSNYAQTELAVCTDFPVIMQPRGRSQYECEDLQQAVPQHVMLAKKKSPMELLFKSPIPIQCPMLEQRSLSGNDKTISRVLMPVLMELSLPVAKCWPNTRVI